MSPDATGSEGFRDSLLERILVSRWSAGMGTGAMLGVMVGALCGPGLAWVAERAVEFGILGGVPWVLCYLLGGLGGLGLGLAIGKIRAAITDKLGRSGVEPGRLRRARLALVRGELVDDPEANRLAAVQARRNLEDSPKQQNRKAIRSCQGALLCWAASQLFFLVSAVPDGNVSRMILHGGMGVSMLLFATVLLPAEHRTRRRNERVVALYAVENLYRRNLDPASGHRSM